MTLEQIVTLKNGNPVATSMELSKDLMDKYVFQGPNLKPWQATLRLSAQISIASASQDPRALPG